VAPARTPFPIIQYLNQQITAVLMLPEVREQFAKIAVEPVGGSVAETAKFFADEREKWRGVIKSANVTVE
jgi:tripartite-type tricarboxylate transporter receptor subunit TctC